MKSKILDSAHTQVTPCLEWCAGLWGQENLKRYIIWGKNNPGNSSVKIIKQALLQGILLGSQNTDEDQTNTEAATLRLF